MRIAKDPLLHFLLIGAALFGFSAWRASSRPDSESEANRLHVTAVQIQGLREQWRRQYHRAPTEPELRAAVDELIREQVLYREAMALGLDQDDTVVRRRLAQKMEFLSADVLEAATPDEPQLQRYLDEHAARYARPGILSFRHVYFSTERRGAIFATADANRALAELAEPGASDDAMGDPFLHEFEFVDRSEREIGDLFGPEFTVALATSPLDRWVGPVTSTYGVHLVRISGRRGADPARLDDVREAVVRDYQEERRREANRRTLDLLRQRYNVTIDETAITTEAPELLKTAQVAP